MRSAGKRAAKTHGGAQIRTAQLPTAKHSNLQEERLNSRVTTEGR